MRKATISFPKAKWLNLGGGGGGRDKTEYLLIGVLGVIIVGALVLVIWQFFGGGGGGTTGPRETRFQCLNEECKYEWTMTPEEFQKQMESGEEMMMDPAMGMMRATCPKCGSEAGLMTKCPKCDKWFLPEAARNPDYGMEGMEEGICPYCDVDVDKYRIEQWKKRTGR